MRQRYLRFITFLLSAALASCTVPNPNKRYRDGGMDGAVPDGPDPNGPVVTECTANQALRCDGANLVRCNADGTGAVSESCSGGCSADLLRCTDKDIVPSNGMAKFFVVASSQPDLNLGRSATFDTDTGEVIVDGSSIQVHSEILVQPTGPIVRVFAAKSLITQTVFIRGKNVPEKNAFAFVTTGDIKIGGVFSASAEVTNQGPGALDDSDCQGGQPSSGDGGKGGGGFGGAGGSGGSTQSASGSTTGGKGGSPTGNAELVPLRGGCSSRFSGAGGGAIQLVSRSQILVSGIVAANGGQSQGGGSGGGILLEAPIVEVSGGIVANGASGSGGPGNGLPGQLNTMVAKGGDPLETAGGYLGRGGDGGAGTTPAKNGDDVVTAKPYAQGGSGGGGVGRIRVNTATGSIRGTGFFSPPASTGVLGSR